MQINHSENYGKCYGNHAFGFDCQNSTALIAGEVNRNGAIIDLTQQSNNLCYFGEQPYSSTASFTKHKSTDQITIYEDSRKIYQENYLLLNSNLSEENTKFACEFPWSSPNDLRKLGWSVAVHNDYKLNSENYTFWLMIKGNIALKGEGKTDEEALNQIREQILRGKYE